MAEREQVRHQCEATDGSVTTDQMLELLETLLADRVIQSAEAGAIIDDNP